jgi:hypothetical protein
MGEEKSFLAYDVVYVGPGVEKGFKIANVIQDGYIAIEGTALPIRWFLTVDRIRYEIKMEAGSRLAFGKERQTAIETSPMPEEPDA